MIRDSRAPTWQRLGSKLKLGNRDLENSGVETFFRLLLLRLLDSLKSLNYNRTKTMEIWGAAPRLVTFN